MVRILYIPISLLSVAGFDGKVDIEIIGMSNAFEPCLKDEFRSPAPTFTALLDAFAAPSVNEYQEILFSYKLPHMSIELDSLEKEDIAIRQANFINDQKRHNKESSRRQQVDERFRTVSKNKSLCDFCLVQQLL